MHTKAFCGGILLATACAASAQSPATTETLVFVRHGEKPAVIDNGQLTCQGVNRSIALAPVLLSKFGAPDFLFAAGPEEDQDDNGNNYYYLRALATIEPTAGMAGQTIDLKFDKDDIDDLEKELMKSAYANSVVFTAWEHTEMDELVANIVHDNGGDSSVVPAWPDDDYDSIFVVTLTRTGSQTAVTFGHDYEGLNGMSAICPLHGSSIERPATLPPPLHR
jgi:hypothetical protein